MYVPSFANISILEINFRKTYTEFLLYQSLRSRWYGSHEILKKVYRIIFCSDTPPGRPASMFCFLQFCQKRGGGEGFYYLRTQFLRFLRLPFLFEGSIFYPFFRVLLSFTISSNNANFKVVQTCTLMKGNVFPICRERFFSTNH